MWFSELSLYKKDKNDLMLGYWARKEKLGRLVHHADFNLGLGRVRERERDCGKKKGGGDTQIKFDMLREGERKGDGV